jgi:hypothetical protein
LYKAFRRRQRLIDFAGVIEFLVIALLEEDRNVLSKKPEAPPVSRLGE